MSDADMKLKQAIREKALKDLELFYEERKTNIEKQKAKNRLAEVNEPDERNGSVVDSSNRWEKVADLVDFQTRSEKDTSRMKSILLSLKDTPTAAS